MKVIHIMKKIIVVKFVKNHVKINIALANVLESA